MNSIGINLRLPSPVARGLAGSPPAPGTGSDLSQACQRRYLDPDSCYRADLEMRSLAGQLISVGHAHPAGDAIHVTTAQDLSEREIWTNDRHMLGAATHFGLVGRSV
jgi:hypothetical protein